MRDEIIISKDAYIQLVNALEKVIYVLHGTLTVVYKKNTSQAL